MRQEKVALRATVERWRCSFLKFELWNTQHGLYVAPHYCSQCLPCREVFAQLHLLHSYISFSFHHPLILSLSSCLSLTYPHR